MPGYPVTKADVNNRAGAISLAVRNALTEAAAFDAWLDTQPDADLVNLGFVQAEVNTIKSAFADLAQLSTIWTGAVNLASAKDFRTFAKLLYGVN